MNDDVIGTVTGTATFEKVMVESADKGELFEVTGYYEDTTTVYRTPRLRIEGFKIDGQISGEIVLEPTRGNGWVWAVASDDELSLLSVQPPDDG